MGGLDVYSGYWLATDSPANGTEDALQEEGIDTLRRVMEAAGIKFHSENGMLCSAIAHMPLFSATHVILPYQAFTHSFFLSLSLSFAFYYAMNWQQKYNKSVHCCCLIRA